MVLIQQVAQKPHDLYTSLEDDEQSILNTEYVEYVKKTASVVWSSAAGLKKYIEVEDARLASRAGESKSAHNGTSIEMAQDEVIMDDAELPYKAQDIELQNYEGQGGLKKHVSHEQPDSPVADDAVIYGQTKSAELIKDTNIASTSVDTKQTSEGNANSSIDAVVADQCLKTMTGRAVSVLHHANQDEQRDVMLYSVQKPHLENTTCAMNEDIVMHPNVQEITEVDNGVQESNTSIDLRSEWTRLYNLVCKFSNNKISKEKIVQLTHRALLGHKPSNSSVSVKYVADAFKPGGLLGDTVADMAIAYIEDKLRRSNSKKKIIGYRVTIMFPVLDDPEGKRGSIGHWFTLTIDIVDRKLRVYDSLREPGNKELEKICTPMVKHLKHMGNEGFGSTQSNIQTLDDYEVVYEHMPLQDNGCDCGFFMLYMLENCIGQHVPAFNKDDIGQFKELFLMKMLIAEIFDISIEAMDDSILGTGETNFNRLFPNKSIQDCRDQLLRGIDIREVEHSQQEMVALEETSQLEIDNKRNTNRPAKIKESMHNDERRRIDQDEISDYKPLDLEAAHEASKVQKLIINNMSKEEYAE
ncbi:hypothetical protein ACQ4PT_018886 [Festuca glaucescens]